MRVAEESPVVSVDFLTAEERHDYYIAKGDDAELRSKRCTSSDDRHSWEQVAASWRFMAAQIVNRSKV